jgi:hypothetical protein
MKCAFGFYKDRVVVALLDKSRPHHVTRANAAWTRQRERFNFNIRSVGVDADAV